MNAPFAAGLAPELGEVQTVFGVAVRVHDSDNNWPPCVVGTDKCDQLAIGRPIQAITSMRRLVASQQFLPRAVQINGADQILKYGPVPRAAYGGNAISTERQFLTIGTPSDVCVEVEGVPAFVESHRLQLTQAAPID